MKNKKSSISKIKHRSSTSKSWYEADDMPNTIVRATLSITIDYYHYVERT